MLLARPGQLREGNHLMNLFIPPFHFMQSPAAAGAPAGGGPGIAYQVTFTGSDGGWNTLNFVGIISASNLANVTGTQFKLTITFTNFLASQSHQLDNLYFGRQAASGDPYDFNGNQVQILFSGSNVIASDGVTLV